MRVIDHGSLDAMTNGKRRMDGKQTARDVLGKPFFLIIGIADGHLEYGFLKSCELFVRMRLNEQGDPTLEAYRCQPWDVGPLVKLFLDEVMLAFELAVHAGDGALLIIENDCRQNQ